jgi:hypothetical protein
MSKIIRTEPNKILSKAVEYHGFVFVQGCTAKDTSQDITGQVFYVSGGLVQLFQGWTPVGDLSKDGRWSPEELAERLAANTVLQFGTGHLRRNASVPPFTTRIAPQTGRPGHRLACW